ncbi:3'(2'),5'-bisphosphate nucleotidase CysQ [Hydrogenothermus marinus]|uniref:3'(2'),5'-bisphosphate nucleotidase CysQ n=1 Tax=Hydrogenothermus marinus TaxID=133270 RepID=A0A3M0B835_9AQUI|nr:3'(2'),5'-bisphosphate nucleotidase CysQ [Hydrogenothermus marinus]RMA93321.1 3'(2'),5'-bisphosphate nucleotidase [Hydrogenothermus marinus]
MIKSLISIAKKAGEEILEIYNKDFEIEYKDDKSPLTEADKKAHKIIKNGLSEISDFPVLSEEGKEIPSKDRKNWEYFWMVDPLDGTKEFIKKNGEFTVNIALIHKNKPILGVVYAPVLDIMYYGDIENGGYKIEKGKKEKLPLKKQKKDTVSVVMSKSHLNEETSKFVKSLKKYFKNIEAVSIGSSLKICLVAEGKADIYPRLAPTMEWDTAAAHAVLNAVGGKIIKYEDSFSLSKTKNYPEISYNKENLLNPYFIAIRSDVF